MFWPKETSRPLRAPSNAATAARVSAIMASVSRLVTNWPCVFAFDVR